MRTPNGSNEDQRQKRKDQRAEADRNRLKSGQGGSTQPQPNTTLGATEEGKKLLAVAGQIPPGAAPQKGAKEKVQNIDPLDAYPETGDVEMLFAKTEQIQQEKAVRDGKIVAYRKRAAEDTEKFLPGVKLWGKFTADKNRAHLAREISDLKSPVMKFLEGLRFVEVKREVAEVFFAALAETMPKNNFGISELKDFLKTVGFANYFATEPNEMKDVLEIIYLENKRIRTVWIQPLYGTPETVIETLLAFVEEPMAEADAALSVLQEKQQQEEQERQERAKKEKLAELDRFYANTLPFNEAAKIGGEAIHTQYENGVLVGKLRLSFASGKAKVVGAIGGYLNLAKRMEEFDVAVSQKDLAKPMFQPSESIPDRRELMGQLWEMINIPWKSFLEERELLELATKNPQWADPYQAYVEKKRAVSTYRLHVLYTGMSRGKGGTVTLHDPRIVTDSAMIEEFVEVKEGEKTVQKKVEKWMVRVLRASRFAVSIFAPYMKEVTEVKPGPKGNPLERFLYFAGQQLEKAAKETAGEAVELEESDEQEPTPAPAEPVNTGEAAKAEVLTAKEEPVATTDPKTPAVPEVKDETAVTADSQTPELNGSNGAEDDPSTPEEPIEPKVNGEASVAEAAISAEKLPETAEMADSGEQQKSKSVPSGTDSTEE